MLRQPFAESGGLVGHEHREPPLSRLQPRHQFGRSLSILALCRSLRQRSGFLSSSPKNFLATCTSSVPPLSCAHLIPLVSYAVTATQPSFPTRNRSHHSQFSRATLPLLLCLHL